jgi:nucleotide-binding universal stress UspA family protein
MSSGTVLVALGGWADGARLAPATAMLRPHGRAEVVHVFEDGDQDLARRAVDHAVAQLREQGVEADGHVAARAGFSVADRLTLEASERGASLIVVGSRGRDRLGSLTGPSVSHDLPPGVDAGVLAVPDRALLPQGGFRRVLVALDGDQDASLALGVLATMPDASEVLLLHVARRVALRVPAGGGASLELPETSSDLLEAARGSVRRTGFDVTTRLVPEHGRVSQSIANAARDWNADLDVLCSHRPGGLAGLITGSTAHGVLHHGDRPVLLARRMVTQ